MRTSLILLGIALVAFSQPVAEFTAATVAGDRLRVLDVKYTPRAVQITGLEAAGNENAGVLDAAQFNFTTYNETTLSFGYIHAAAVNGGGGQAAQVAALFFALRSFVLLEYLDNDGQPGFQITNGTNADQVISYYDLSNPALPWKPLKLNSTTVQGGANTSFKVSYIEAETEDEVFFIRFVVTEHPVYVGNVRISPDKSKIDFGIRYYNPKHVQAAWTTGPSNSGLFPNAKVGYVAVSVSAAAFSAFDNRTGANASSAVTFGSGLYVGNFTWAPTAQVTVGVTEVDAVVYASVSDNMGSFGGQMGEVAYAQGISVKFLVFSFEGDRPDFVYWDPVFGGDIAYNELPTDATTSPTAAASTANTIAFALAALLFSLLVSL